LKASKEPQTVKIDFGVCPKGVPIVGENLAPLWDVLRDVDRQDGVKHASGEERCGVLALPHLDIVFPRCPWKHVQ
jgi:hypothetical protein